MFRFLAWLPFIGSAFRRSGYNFVFTDRYIEVPINRCVEAFMRLLLSAAVIVAVLLFLPYDKLFPAKTISYERLINSFHSDGETFDKAVSAAEREQLIRAIDELSDDPTNEYADRAELFNRKIIAAEKISKSRLPTHRVIGIDRNLDLRSQLELLNFESGRFDPVTHAELLKLADLYKSVNFEGQESESEELVQRANLAEIVALVVEIVEQDKKEFGPEETQTVLAKVESLSIDFLDMDATRATLGKLSSIATRRLNNTGRSAVVFDKLNDSIAFLSEEDTSVVAENFRNFDVGHASRHAQLKEQVDTDPFIEDFVGKFNRVLELNDLSTDGYKSMLEKLLLISRAGWVEESKELLARLMEKLETVDDPGLLSDAQHFSTQLAWYGQRFSLVGLKTLNGAPAKYPAVRLKAIVILLFNPEKESESKLRLSQIARFFSRIRLSDAGLAITFVYQGDDKAVMEVMGKLAENTRGVQFFHLNVDSRNDITQHLQLEELPFVLVLDEKHRIVGLNPARLEFESLVNALVAGD